MFLFISVGEPVWVKLDGKYWPGQLEEIGKTMVRCSFFGENTM